MRPAARRCETFPDAPTRGEPNMFIGGGVLVLILIIILLIWLL
jgi:flagellar biogenesis protein FliO